MKKGIPGAREFSRDDSVSPTYGRRWDIESVPKTKIPEKSMRSDVAYQLIKDEMNLDGNPCLNLATFVTTWMEPEAEKLLEEGSKRNLIDEDEYPQLKIIEDRIIQMEANLFNVPKDCEPTGVTTIGSSEAIMLGLLAHKWSWRKRMKAEGKDTSRPNVIFGADVHSCWEKFGRYFDVEMKIIPLSPGKYTINADDVEPLIDENTIAVGAILGTTFTGQVDDIQSINKLLLKIKKEKGWNIPIHVDAASGGFVVPFVEPHLKWDFRLEQVRSINVSNHKFGLVYAGMGSVIFKDKSDLPEELPFEINYLGGTMYNYSLNFSKGSSRLLAQYYMFLRLGIEGYAKIMKSVMANAKFLEDKLTATGKFQILTDSKYLPVVVARLTDTSKYTAYDISDNLRKFGWIVPAYSLPPNATSTVVLRFVVKENFSHDLAEKLLQDVETVIEEQEKEALPTFKKSSRTHGVC